MLDSNEIDKALDAHAAWKARLIAAVETGEIEVPLATIATDNQCAFGKWLYGPSLNSGDKADGQWEEIRQLHAEFHKVAAKVASLATGGSKGEAQKMMDFGREYTQISGQLSLALKRWKKSFVPSTVK